MRLAQVLLEAAAVGKQQRGSTFPNPPVGAAAVDREGRLLSVQAHVRAGEDHAEVRVIKDLREKGLMDQLHTLVVTLEPCNHWGKTPPCSQALVELGVKQVVYGLPDPHSKASGGGKVLRDAGVSVLCPATDLQLGSRPEWQDAVAACRGSLRGFLSVHERGRPWITVKQALNDDGTMIPPVGQKTFSSEESLVLAHKLRRQADALVTGSGTVLIDRPLFTVRKVPDFLGRPPRKLIILDRRGRVLEQHPDELARFRSLGLEPEIWSNSWEQGSDELWRFLAKQGVMEVLVEAGPTVLSQLKVWDEWITTR